VRRCLHQEIGEFAVVGEQEQPFAGVVEATHGIDARAHPVEQIHDRRPMFGIVKGGDVSLGLVHQQINMALGALEEFAVDADVIHCRISLASQFRDDQAVYGHKSARDDLLCFAARGNSGSGDNFLQAFSGHRRVGRTEIRLIALDQTARIKNPAVGSFPL
jgi:hypothetical protein